MRQRTRSRSRARSQANTSVEEDNIALGLQRFLDKLRQYQPLFTEEDVVAIPFPADNGSSCTSSPSSSAPISPRVSPSRLDNEGLQVHQRGSDAQTAFPLPADEEASKKPASVTAKSNVASHAAASSIDLDVPLSSALFVTAVNLFDAKMLAKSKRVASDALRLVRQAYALVWNDVNYLAILMSGEPYRGPGAIQSGACAAEPLVSRRNSRGMRRVPFSAAAPAPNQQPNRQLSLLLDECVRVLLVYANVSVNFCQSVSSNSRVLLLLSFVCCSARRLEEEDEAPYGEGRGSAADIVVGNRNLHTEMDSLEQVWQACGIEGRIVDALQECYLIEFLLDAALPPAVCSSRYDGLLAAVFEKKRRVVSDVVASRSGFAHMMRAAPLHGLCGLANMSAFADAKLRARLLDKMALEGVVERLSSEIAFSMEAALAESDPSSNTFSSSKRPRSTASRGTSPPHQGSRIGTSALASGRASLEAPQPPRSTNEAESHRGSTGLDRILNAQPTAVERIGHCVDILMLLSSPNLCPPESSEGSSSRTSASSPPGAVRATTWASHETALHEISLHLLAICFLSKTHPRYAELASLQLYAADCVLQWAAYSGKFYTMIVQSLNELLDMIESVDSRQNSQTVSPLRPRSRSSSRSPPAAKQRAGSASSAPGQRLLRQLLPGDETGLLPLLTNLLQYTIHAEANATSVRRWFIFLADRILPSVFEAPLLTTGRRSSSMWGRQHQQQVEQGQSQLSGRASSRPPISPPSASTSLTDAEKQLSPPVLARDLTRAEVVAVAPYFRFVRQVVEETSWRAGTAALLSKVVLLAFNVIVTQGHRCNLVFGQACACYDVAAPLLLEMSGRPPQLDSRRSSSGWRSSDESHQSTYRRSTLLMHQLRSEEEEEAQRRTLSSTPAKKQGGRNPSLESGVDEGVDAEEVFICSAMRRRSPSKRGRQQGSPQRRRTTPESSPVADEESERQADFSPFINSPSGSPVFYEPRSPSTADTFESRDGSEDTCSPSAMHNRGSNLRSALEEAATPPPAPPPCESPGSVTLSWTGRLSLRALLSSISGHEEAPLQDI